MFRTVTGVVTFYLFGRGHMSIRWARFTYLMGTEHEQAAGKIRDPRRRGCLRPGLKRLGC
jgi:hypothetical protein